MTSTPPTRPIGAILTGGASRRFGSDKALAPFRGRPLAAIVIDAFRQAGVDPVVAVGGTAGSTLGIVTVPDRYPGEGPLGALATVLTWAGRGRVVVAPCDLPLLTAAHVSTLLSAVVPPGSAAVAVVDGRPAVSVAVWPATAGPLIRQAIDDGERAFRAALDHIEWAGVEIDPAALTDADDSTTLARIERQSDGSPDRAGGAT